jgi:penicillin amidase
MNRLFLFLILPLSTIGQSFTQTEINQWKQQAKQITIIRDRWGVPHIYGKSDADAVFGLMYAQCEDNYWQIEETMIRQLGRAAEIYGEKELQADASVALFECVKRGKEMYVKASSLLKALCDAATAGINLYIHTHPAIEKRLLRKYEPWFFLIPSSLNPSSHGISTTETRNVFTQSLINKQAEGIEELFLRTESGSNTIALAPKKTSSGNSMLLINPHVNFFGNGQRYEAHLVSEEGLNVSGFAMLADFFIWSGFNQYCGWAHTNTASDFEDVYLEQFNHPSDSTMYQYGDDYRRAIIWTDTILSKGETGLAQHVFQFKKTHHGAVVANRDSFDVTIKNASTNTGAYILQAWAMCKAKNRKEFTSAMARVQLNTNTMYSDRFGNIAYWHGNAIPKRNKNFDWRFPVDGSNPATEWKGVHSLSEIIHIINPSNGWIQNCNSTPFLSTGIPMPAKEKYHSYMAYDEKTFRSEEVIRLLTNSGRISFSNFEQMVTSNHLPMMTAWLPQITAAYDRQTSVYPELKKLNDIIDTLRNWNHRYSLTSKATTIAVFWYMSYFDWVRNKLKDKFYSQNPEVTKFIFEKRLPIPDSIMVLMLQRATDTLQKRYGTAFVSWGEINRLQRIHTSGTIEKFDDNKNSLPVSAVPGTMGSLFSFNTRAEPAQKKIYGIAGNTYVAIVEFGKRIKAKSIVYFGQNADPASPHYFDQAPLYVKGKFKDVYFYKEDVEKNAEKNYHPGE